jgi:hypothetical protein
VSHTELSHNKKLALLAIAIVAVAIGEILVGHAMASHEPLPNWLQLFFYAVSPALAAILLFRVSKCPNDTRPQA